MNFLPYRSELLPITKCKIIFFLYIYRSLVIGVAIEKNLSVSTLSIDCNMVSIKFCLIFLFFSNIFIAPATGILPPNAQDFELDNIPSVRDEFPSLIGKLKTIGMVFYK